MNLLLSRGLLIACCCLPGQLLAGDKDIIGWLEHVGLDSRKFSVKAKIDTGADSSSLHASNVRFVNRETGEYVQFTVHDENDHRYSFEKKVIKYVLVKRKNADSVRRPVVSFDLCIGNVHRNVEVNLSDRNNFNYKMLIGRSYLEKYFIVDPALMFSVEPACYDLNHDD